MRVKLRVCATTQIRLCVRAQKQTTKHLDESFLMWYSGFTRSGKDQIMTPTLTKSAQALVDALRSAGAKDNHPAIRAIVEDERNHVAKIKLEGRIGGWQD